VFEGNQAPEVKKRDIVELDNFDLAKRDEDLYRGQVFWTNTGRVLNSVSKDYSSYSSYSRIIHE
jgi:hypothetical protein